LWTAALFRERAKWNKETTLAETTTKTTLKIKATKARRNTIKMILKK